MKRFLVGLSLAGLVFGFVLLVLIDILWPSIPECIHALPALIFIIGSAFAFHYLVEVKDYWYKETKEDKENE